MIALFCLLGMEVKVISADEQTAMAYETAFALKPDGCGVVTASPPFYKISVGLIISFQN